MQALTPAQAYGFGAFNVLLAALILYKGLRSYKKFRYLEDTPQSAAGGVAIGFVRLRGRPTGEKKLLSPVRHIPCFYYAVQISAIEDRIGVPWTDSKSVKFYLQDDTGRVLVDPTGLEPRWAPYCGHKVIQPRRPPTALQEVSEGGADSVPQEPEGYVFNFLTTFLKSHPHSLPAALSLKAGGTALVAEWAIATEKTYTVYGTCIENPQPDQVADTRMIAKGQENPNFAFFLEEEHRLQLLRLRAIRVFISSGAALMVLGLALLLVPIPGWIFLPAWAVCAWGIVASARRIWWRKP